MTHQTPAPSPSAVERVEVEQVAIALRGRTRRTRFGQVGYYSEGDAKFDNDAADLLDRLAERSGFAGDGWIVGNGAGDRWRAWDSCGPIWVDDREKATRYARREDAENVHREDEDAWSVVPYATVCTVPPEGWSCSREPGHSGPCAATALTPQPEKQSAERGGEGWRDIGTAPKDGTWFVARQDGETYACQWERSEPDEGAPHEGWFDLFNRSFEAPTHWCPATPPSERGGEDALRDAVDREMLGREVREAWVKWARKHPTPKPSWLEPYDALCESDKEADRQIGEHIWYMAINDGQREENRRLENDSLLERLSRKIARIAELERIVARLQSAALTDGGKQPEKREGLREAELRIVRAHYDRQHLAALRPTGADNGEGK